MSDTQSRRSMEASFQRILSGDLRKTRLNTEKAREIRRLHAEGWRQIDLAHRFGVNENLISNVIHNRSWREK